MLCNSKTWSNLALNWQAFWFNFGHSVTRSVWKLLRKQAHSQWLLAFFNKHSTYMTDHMNHNLFLLLQKKHSKPFLTRKNNYMSNWQKSPKAAVMPARANCDVNTAPNPFIRLLDTPLCSSACFPTVLQHTTVHKNLEVHVPVAPGIVTSILERHFISCICALCSEV